MINNPIINRAIDYILSHLTDDIQLEDVADFCGLSKFYFSRLFKAETGESVYAFIKRVKIEESAWRLKVEKTRTITDVGIDFGYSASNYSTLFRNYFKTNPITFRKKIVERSLKHPFFHVPLHTLATFEECSQYITVEKLPDFFVLYERYIGNYHNLSDNWCSFCEKYGKNISDSTVFIESTINDPSITDTNTCLYDICMTVPKDCPAKNTMTLPGGTFAVYHYKGNPAGIYSAYQNLFCVWFEKTGNRIGEHRSFDIYRNVDSAAMYFEIDICIPLR